MSAVAVSKVTPVAKLLKSNRRIVLLNRRKGIAELLAGKQVGLRSGSEVTSSSGDVVRSGEWGTPVMGDVVGSKLLSRSPDVSFARLSVQAGMYLGSFDNRLCREMRPYAVGAVETGDKTWQVVWNLRLMEDCLARLMKALEKVTLKGGKVMIVCTHRQRSRLAVMSFGDLDCVRLVTKKWLNGMLSNHSTLRELVLKYRVTPSFEISNATRERFDRYLAPMEKFLSSTDMPSLVLFINSEDHVTSIREVYNMGIPVGALCDVDASWNTFVDYAVPFPSRANAKSNVVMTEFETRELAQTTPRFAFMTMVRFARKRGLEQYRYNAALEGSESDMSRVVMERGEYLSSLGKDSSERVSRRGGRRVVSSGVVVPKGVTSMGVVSYGVSAPVRGGESASSSASGKSGGGKAAGKAVSSKVTKQQSRKSGDSGVVVSKVKERSMKAVAVASSASKGSSKGSESGLVKSAGAKPRGVKSSETISGGLSATLSSLKKSSTRVLTAKEVKPEVVVSAKVASKDVKPKLVEAKKAGSKSVTSGGSGAGVKGEAPKRVKRPSGGDQKK